MEVLIRPWQTTDAEPLALIADNRKIFNLVRDRFPSPYTLADANQWIGLAAAQQPAENFAIEYKGALAGAMGCIPGTDIYRCNVEVGYFLGEPFWGRGIATAAMSQLLEILATRRIWTRAFAGVFENNPGSMRVLEKNGFRLESIHRKGIIKNGVLLDEYIWVRPLGETL